MSGKEFDLGDYVQVKDRIAKFYELYGNGRLVTSQVLLTKEPDDKPRVLVEAKAYRNPEDPLPGVGWSWLELPGKSPYTNGSEVENAETSAWGRAIAALGVLTEFSIASRQEVRDKQGETNGRSFTLEPHEPPVLAERAKPRTTDDGGLIGTAITQGTQDFELRETPQGPALPFRVKDGKQTQIVIAHGPLANTLRLMRDDVIGKRVTVWGPMHTETFPKDGKTISYTVLDLVRIKGEDWLLPAPEQFDATEQAAIDAALAAATT